MAFFANITNRIMTTAAVAVVIPCIANASSLYTESVWEWFDTYPESQEVTYLNFCWGIPDTRGPFRLYDRSNGYSSYAALLSIIASYFERSVRFGLYDGASTKSGIFYGTDFMYGWNSPWAVKYTLYDQEYADLTPSSYRHYNGIGSKRIIGAEVLHKIAFNLFGRQYQRGMDCFCLSGFCWTSALTLSGDVEYPIESDWTAAEPYSWYSCLVSRWAYALPTLSHIDSIPFDDAFSKLHKTPDKILLFNDRSSFYNQRYHPEGMWLKVSRDGYLGTAYEEEALAKAKELTLPVKRTLQGSTNIVWSNIFEGFGFMATNANIICDRFSEWASISNSYYASKRLDADAIGGFNWSVAAVDETYVEPSGYDCGLNVKSTCGSEHRAPFETDEVTMHFRPNSVGVPIFTPEQPIYARRTGEYEKNETWNCHDFAFTNNGYVSFWENPRSVSLSAGFEHTSTNYIGWYVMASSQSRFDALLYKLLDDNKNDIMHVKHLGWSKMTIKVRGVGWVNSPHWQCASVHNDVTLSNSFGVATYQPSEALFLTEFDQQSASFGPFKALGTLKVSRTVESGGTLPSNPVGSYIETNAIIFADGPGWPTDNMWENADIDKITLYELSSGYCTTNRSNIRFELPGNTNGVHNYYKTAKLTASSRSGAYELRTNRVNAAIGDLAAMAAIAGSELGITTDPRISWHCDAAQTLMGVADMAKYDSILNDIPAIPQGHDLESDYGLLSLTGTEIASERTYTADVEVYIDDDDIPQLRLVNKSWETNYVGFARWSWLKPNYDDISTFCTTNYGGFACGVVNAHMLKMTFDNSKWKALSVESE